MITIAINVNGKRMELSADEAQRIYDELRRVFGQRDAVGPVYVPAPYVYPAAPWPAMPYTTCGTARPNADRVYLAQN